MFSAEDVVGLQSPANMFNAAASMDVLASPVIVVVL
jgi:hypothetical protein